MAAAPSPRTIPRPPAGQSGRRSRLGLRRSTIGVLALTGCLLGGCTCNDEPRGRKSSPLVAPPPRPPVVQRPVRTVLRLPASAYGNTLVARDGQFWLLTEDELIRITASGAVERRAIALGVTARPMGNRLVFHADGHLNSADTNGEDAVPLVALATAPYLLLTSDDRFAWVVREGELFTIQTLRGQKPSELYRTSARITAGTMLQDWVFVVESHANHWRVVGVPTGGGAIVTSGDRQGRPPSLLVAGDGLYFYDGPQRGVRHLTPDLRTETEIKENVICSPLAVSDRVVCAQVGGLYELLLTEGAPRILAAESEGPIAAVAASELNVVWITDTGPEQLAVKLMDLAPAVAKEAAPDGGDEVLDAGP